MNNIGEILRSGRDRKKWSQEELAKRIHVDRSIVSRIETGTIAQPSYVLVKQWAKVCECEDLVGLDLTGSNDAWLKLTQLESKINKIKELVNFMRVKTNKSKESKVPTGIRQQV